MKFKVTRATVAVVVGIVGATLLMRRPVALAQPPGVRDPRYLIQGVTLTGPAATDANGNANYTVQIRVWRETVPLSNGVDGTVLLLDGNTTVGSAVFTVLRLTNDTTVTVPVSCRGRGTISLVARVNEWDSTPLTVACAGKTGC